MYIIRKGLLVVALSLVLIGCSSKDEGGSAADANLEDLEEEMGVTVGDEGGIPSELPKDVYVADDMEVEYTVENEIMSQLHYTTDDDFDDLVAAYKEYLEGNSAFSGLDESLNEEGGYKVAFFGTTFENNSLEVMIMTDDDEERRSVDIVRYDDDALDEMLEEMQKQMEED